MRIKNKKSIAIIAAIILTLSVSAEFTLAYFNDHTKAVGSAKLHLTGQTDIIEEVGDNSKAISVKNESKEPVDMVTRIKVVGPGEFEPYEFTQTDPKHWVKGTDDWWYYDQALAPEQSTETITVTWKIPSGTSIENYDVAVLHESAVARYSDDGRIQYPDDWDGPSGGM